MRILFYFILFFVRILDLDGISKETEARIIPRFPDLGGWVDGDIKGTLKILGADKDFSPNLKKKIKVKIQFTGIF